MLKIFRKLGISVFMKLINKIYIALFTCIFAIGGAAVGAVAGAIKGVATETGFSRGSWVGAVAGAVTGVELAELVVNGEPFSKIALISSLVNGKIFMEWVNPAILRAYQWQASGMEPRWSEFSDIFDVATFTGLSQHSIQDLPFHVFHDATSSSSRTTCAICLENMKNGESTRSLPRCEHVFHLHCIDEWLMRRGSCPMCRKPINTTFDKSEYPENMHRIHNDFTFLF